MGKQPNFRRRRIVFTINAHGLGSSSVRVQEVPRTRSEACLDPARSGNDLVVFHFPRRAFMYMRRLDGGVRCVLLGQCGETRVGITSRNGELPRISVLEVQADHFHRELQCLNGVHPTCLR